MTCICHQAIVVVPASLAGNWNKEVKHWLGVERMQVRRGLHTSHSNEAVTVRKIGYTDARIAM